MSYLQPVLGLIVFLGFVLAISRDRSAVSAKRIAVGLAMQLAIAFFLLRVPFVANGLLSLNAVVSALQSVTDRASR